MTTLQKNLIAVIFTAVVSVGVYESQRASNARVEFQTLKQNQALQIQRLQHERDELAHSVIQLQNDNERLKQNSAELLKLRSDIEHLKKEAQAISQANAANAADTAVVQNWLSRVNQLKTYLENNPNEQIPEIKFLNDKYWLKLANPKLNSEAFEKEDNYRSVTQTMRSMRFFAQDSFAIIVEDALKKYSSANNSKFPSQFLDLGPFCEPEVVQLLEQLYEIKPASILPADKVTEWYLKGDFFITRKKPVNQNASTRIAIFSQGHRFW